MLLGEVFERKVKDSPVTVMVRLLRIEGSQSRQTG